LIKGFNARREEVVEAGDLLVASESIRTTGPKVNSQEAVMIGDVAKFHRSVEERKNGFLIRSLIDNSTNIVLQLELEEDLKGMLQKDFQAKDVANLTAVGRGEAYKKQAADGDVHSYHTANLMRLAKSYFGSKRVVVGEPNFSSLAAVLACKLHGLEYVGSIKANTTASANKPSEIGFPSLYLNSHATVSGGAASIGASQSKRVSLTADFSIQVKKEKLMALGFHTKSSEEVDMLIASIGSNEVGQPVQLTHRLYEPGARNLLVDGRFVDQQVETVEQPLLMQEYREILHQTVVEGNVHRYLIPSGISRAAEASSSSLNWYMRCFFTIFGVICSDAYSAYRFENSQGQDAATERPVLSYREFLSELALSLAPRVRPSCYSSSSAFAAPKTPYGFASTIDSVGSDVKQEGNPMVDLRRIIDAPSTKAKITVRLQEQEAKMNSEEAEEGETEETTEEKKKKATAALTSYFDRKRCSVCKSLCSHYCVHCSDFSGKLVAVHHPYNSTSKHKTCYSDHLRFCYRKSAYGAAETYSPSHATPAPSAREASVTVSQGHVALTIGEGDSSFTIFDNSGNTANSSPSSEEQEILFAAKPPSKRARR
jgi:hypothetical protein